MDFILGPTVTQKSSSDFIAACIPLKNEGLCKVLVHKERCQAKCIFSCSASWVSCVCMNSLLFPTRMIRNITLAKVLSKISVKIGEPKGAVKLPDFLWSPSSNGRNALVLWLFPLRRWRIQGVALQWTFHVLCTICFLKHQLDRTSTVHAISQD